MLKDEYIKEKITTAAKRKTRRKDVKKVVDHMDKSVSEIKQLLINEEFIPDFHVPKLINESSCGKIRKIVKPNYKYEQIIHHMVVGQFGEVVSHGIYEHVYGTTKGKGTHKGSDQVEKWMKKYQGKKTYVLKTDIHHFFDSIDRGILKHKIDNVIRDKKFIRLMFILIEYDRIAEVLNEIVISGKDISIQQKKRISTLIAFDRIDQTIQLVLKMNLKQRTFLKVKEIIVDQRKGIPIGYYSSGWLGDFYLKDLDQHIVQDLHPDHYIRYRDDMVFISRNKRTLHRIQKELEGYMREELKIELKGNWQVFRFEYDPDNRKGRMIDFLGFQNHSNRKTLRKSTLRRIKRKSLKIGKEQRTSWYEATQIMSYLGQISHADVYKYYEDYVKPNVNARKMKRIISKHQRKENEKNEIRMEKGRKHSITGTHRQQVSAGKDVYQEEH